MTMPDYVDFAYATRDYADGLALPVSHGTNTWVTIPWDTEIYDPATTARPNGQHDMPGGWTVAYGPALVFGSCFVMVQGGYESDSMHLMARVAKRVSGLNVIQRSWQATERFVGAAETHDGYFSNTHLDLTFGPHLLAADERLQLVADHWNGPAGTDARIVSAGVSLVYWTN